MADALRDSSVLVLDCQASGATPAHGDLLELAWAASGPTGLVEDVRSLSIVPRTERRISAAVRELTGWSEARLSESVPERVAFEALHADVMRWLEHAQRPRLPTVIHMARFELPFLRDLYARLAEREPPLDVICLHAIAARLLPDLPRLSIRALAGHLGHSLGLTRHARGHVEASAFIWQAFVPRLAELGVTNFSDLTLWLSEPTRRPKRSRRSFPLPAERRRALPNRPGVYRFVRKNGDVLYVGKATSLKKRVASHFRSTGPHTERALELLSQVHDIIYTETPSILEAALLESDEIKAFDPPYNVQLRAHERSAWFSSRALDDARPKPDTEHRIGPLPSRGAVSALYALKELVAGAPPSPLNKALALLVPREYVPDDALFHEGFRDLTERLTVETDPRPGRRLLRFALRLWLERGRNEEDESSEDLPPDGWDLARVKRRLDRNLVQAGLMVRRSRWLCLLADADVAFRETRMECARVLSFVHGELTARHDLTHLEELMQRPPRRPSSLALRQRAFDATRYDRVRILSTELQRVQNEGGTVAVRIGSHVLMGARLARIMRTV